MNSFHAVFEEVQVVGVLKDSEDSILHLAVIDFWTLSSCIPNRIEQHSTIQHYKTTQYTKHYKTQHNTAQVCVLFGIVDDGRSPEIQ
jgi:hypothetical protein